MFSFRRSIKTRKSYKCERFSSTVKPPNDSSNHSLCLNTGRIVKMLLFSEKGTTFNENNLKYCEHSTFMLDRNMQIWQDFIALLNGLVLFILFFKLWLVIFLQFIVKFSFFLFCFNQIFCCSFLNLPLWSCAVFFGSFLQWL